MTIPDAARADALGHLTDRLLSEGNPAAEHIAAVAINFVFTALDATGWSITAHDTEPSTRRTAAAPTHPTHTDHEETR
jgi:hypothetical protein